MSRSPSPYFDTFLDRWPSGVAELSMPTRALAMSEADIQALLSQDKTTRRLLGLSGRLDFSTQLVDWITLALPAFDAGVFARLSPCSFVKADRMPRALNHPEQVLKLLMHPGERAASLVWRTWRAGRGVSLCLRAWREIAEWSEFRIFIHRGEVVGVSQYHHQRVYPQIGDRLGEIKAVLADAARRLPTILHLETVVADLYMDGTSWVLIELNPWSPDCGPALFSWDDGGDFDGGLRYRGVDGGCCTQDMAEWFG